MSNKTPLSKIVIASGNAGKIAEIEHALTNDTASSDLELISQKQFDYPEAVEDGLSFIENAIIKARHAARHTQLPALADDSGIVVDYLNGAPGIYSARFAGPDASDADNVAKLLNELNNASESQRSAYFYCALAFVRHADDPTPIIAEGIWHGQIATQTSGNQGFGYDPVFYIPSQQCSAAELSKSDKNKLSHRGQALEKFAALFHTTFQQTLTQS
ncbi:MAG: non-canonical purine NTP pyrophosphatase, RdgB/HAM1 family [Gammaproteobacteria bacterium]|nr:MAG: non-canonical purine NTP pyrophosphatase, RdgB/HAM1 family [Gammaproteobacteria bacterium]